ncbi:MAG: hypothetical protein D6685_05130 [Bacteroidetes bacterium]|nr:MAG: hypothetical protein D6685_05130 [Bacteroidota bacterium]
MKLLFDQNLSPRLVQRLADVYADAAHVSARGLERATDREVWEYARANGFIIVSKDTDFSEMSVVHGHPPKVVCVRRGNGSTREIEALLRRNVALVAELERNQELGVLLLY